jgi:hypothetical protein
LSFFVVAFRVAARFIAGAALLGRRELDPRPPGFGEPDGDGLFGRAGTVLSFADMVKLFADKFARLGGGRLALILVFMRPL